MGLIVSCLTGCLPGPSLAKGSALGSTKLLAADVPDGAQIAVLTLLRADGLLSRGQSGSVEPYVVLTLGGERRMSSRKKGEGDIAWDPNETFRFLVRDPKEPIIVSLYNFNVTGPDDRVGDATVYPIQFDATLHRTQKLKLVDPFTGKGGGGSVTLEIALTDKTQAFAARIDEVFEYQILDRMSREWSTRFCVMDPNGGQCRWSTTDGEHLRYSNDINELAGLVPPAYRVSGDWHVSTASGDSDGWSYTFHMAKGVWYDTQESSSFYRRRRWQRILERKL